MTEYTSQYMLK